MKVEFNIGNRHLLVFVVTAVVVIGLSTGFAEPPNPGHGWEQIEIPAGVWTGLWAEKADTAGSADYATSAGKIYRSGWFFVEREINYQLEHNLNDIPDWCNVYFRESEGASIIKVESDQEVGGRGFSIHNIDSTSLIISTGRESVAWFLENGIVEEYIQGYYRVICGLMP